MTYLGLIFITQRAGKQMTPHTDFQRLLRPILFAFAILSILFGLFLRITSCQIRCSEHASRERTVIRQAEDLNAGRVSEED
jgi:hypothetical protein